MAIKLVEVVTYYERLPSIKLHNPLNKLPYKISWQIKNVLFLPLQCLKPPELAEW